MILFQSPHPHYHRQSRASSGREESQPVSVPPLAVFSTWPHPNSDHHHEHYPCFHLLSQSSLDNHHHHHHPCVDPLHHAPCQLYYHTSVPQIQDEPQKMTLTSETEFILRVGPE